MAIGAIGGVKDLSPPAQEIVETKQCAWRGPFKKCKPFFEELARFDVVMDEKCASAKKTMIMYIVFSFLATFLLVGAVMMATMPGPAGKIAAPIVGIALLACVVQAIRYGTQWSGFKSVDLDNDFRGSLVPLFELIAEDVDPKAKIALDLDLAGSMVKEKITSSGKIPPGRFKKVIETIYNDPWCKLELSLVDGSAVSLTIANQLILHDRRWTTRSRSGKTKFKQKKKWKKLVTLATELRPNAEHLAWNAEQVRSGPALRQESAGKQKLKAAIDKKIPRCHLSTTEKFSAIGNPPTDTISAQSILANLMQLFSMLSETKGEGGEGRA